MPVLFSQTRVGLDEKRFVIFKFRSMFVDSNRPLGDVDCQNGSQDVYVTTAKFDDRITKTGLFMRQKHIDELPQLFNVLRGDMSLVGPRPDAPVQKSDYSKKNWSLRCKARPGLTGLAQVDDILCGEDVKPSVAMLEE